MDKEELKYFAEETLPFEDINAAFEDYIDGLREQDIIELFTEEMKAEIVIKSPSYKNKNGKWYFNDYFQELEENEVEEIINKVESEV